MPSQPNAIFSPTASRRSDAVSADVADSFGEDVTRLRAEVLHLQRLSATPTRGSGWLTRRSHRRQLPLAGAPVRTGLRHPLHRRSRLALRTRSRSWRPAPPALASRTGPSTSRAWGRSADFRGRDGLALAGTVVVDELTPEVTALLSGGDPEAVFFLSSATDDPGLPSWRRMHLVEPARTSIPMVNVHVPVNPLAQLHRHHGFGFTGYQLVLSDRAGTPADPPPAVAWLSAAFPDRGDRPHRRRRRLGLEGPGAPRHDVHVDTRMDLWRLVAHAAVCIDLAPGAHIARECIEALRFGTPIVVPDDWVAAALHARAGGGATFGDPGELIAAVDHVCRTGPTGRPLRRQAAYADAWYGDAGRASSTACGRSSPSHSRESALPPRRCAPPCSIM